MSLRIPRVELETRCLQLYVVILPRREHRYEFRQPADVPPDGILCDFRVVVRELLSGPKSEVQILTLKGADSHFER